jgi:hypothetical protein
MVQSDLVCYAPQTSIDISFENCDPLEEDWIGIYGQDPDVDLTNLGGPLTWLWTCDPAVANSWTTPFRLEES